MGDCYHFDGNGGNGSASSLVNWWRGRDGQESSNDGFKYSTEEYVAAKLLVMQDHASFDGHRLQW